MTPHHSKLAILLPVLATIFATISATSVRAQIRLGPPFRDHMVLQRELPIRVWGSAPPGETMTVRLAEHAVEIRADSAGQFDCTLPARDAGGPHELQVVGSETVTIGDVLVGEVWLCSGQSNMECQMRRFADCAPYVERGGAPLMRLFTVKRATATEAASTCEGRWSRPTPDVVKEFSAVAFHFGDCLAQELRVPIGLIASSWGGTRAEAWTRRAALQGDPWLEPLLAHWDALHAKWPDAKRDYDARLAQWQKDRDTPKAAGKPLPRRPPMPVGPLDRHSPSALFHGMIAPLVPLTIRGVIWYQGESNTRRAEQYRRLFPAMIRDWRAAFGQGDFPFLFVQLANFAQNRVPSAAWAELREAQREALQLPNTGMAVTIDIGNPKDIHPANKREVGRRLSLWALANTYGRTDTVFSGPLYRHMRIEGDRIRLHFDHVGDDGLMAADGGLVGFQIADATRRFVAAEATIDGDTVVAWSKDVAHPVAIRYAWDDDPGVSLFAANGLPASPFRTDDWTGVTSTIRTPR